MGSFRTYSIPGKTAALVPEFAVEDLPSAELQPKFLRLQWRTCPWVEHSDDDVFNKQYMVISEFGNALPQLGHNMAQIVSPVARKDN